MSVNTGQMKLKIKETHHISVADGRYNKKFHRNQHVFEKSAENSKNKIFFPSFSFFKMRWFPHNFLDIALRDTYYTSKFSPMTPLKNGIRLLNVST